MSKRANERSGARDQSKQCGASKQVRSASERASGQANGPVLYASISYSFNPQCGGAQWDGIVCNRHVHFMDNNRFPMSERASE